MTGVTAAPWLSEAEQQMWRGYLDATRLMLRALDHQLTTDVGMSLTDYEVLVLLSEAPRRRMRLRELAEHMSTTRSGITRAVHRLIGFGWVTRAECEEDRRGAYAELTEAGAEKLASASPGHVEAVRRNLFDLLSPRDVASFSHAFAQIRDHLLEQSCPAR